MAKPLKVTTYMKTEDVESFLNTFGFTRDIRFDVPKGTPGHGYYRERPGTNIPDKNKIFKDKATLYGNEKYSTIMFHYDYEIVNL